ncbi:hypothetical protein A7A76_08705 [Lysobacter enzymogenes]|nr:hypothetical protein [Lysobacter enzymogenes]
MAKLAATAATIFIATVTVKLSTAIENIVPRPYCSQRPNSDLVRSSIRLKVNNEPDAIKVAMRNYFFT